MLGNLGAVVVGDAERLRFREQEMIDVLAEPVRVGRVVGRVGADQQFVGAVGARRERPALLVLEKREAALDAAGQVRIGPLPRPVLRQRRQPRQVVGLRQRFQDEIGQRRRGLADGEARVRAALDEDDAAPKPAQHHRQDAAGEARAEDRHVGPLADHAPPPQSQTTGGATACSRFMASRRRARAGPQRGQ